MDPELIKAAAGSPLGVLSLMVLVVSSIALAFFRDADPKIRLTVFILIFAGAAAFAAAVMMQKPTPVPGPVPEPKPPLEPEPQPKPSRPTPSPTPVCRAKSNGFEKWGKVESVTADSGWRGGGSSPAEYCNGELAARKAVLGDTGEIELVNTSEDSKDDNPPFNVRKYRYSCTFTQRTEPIYKLAASPECSAGQ